MEFPIYNKETETVSQYMKRLNDFQTQMDEKRIKLVLNFLNEWLAHSNRKLGRLIDFKNMYYKSLPGNEISKAIMIKHFDDLNNEFNLQLEYDENLFTTYNLLYLVELMVKKIGFRFKKEVFESIKNDKKIKTKRYGIFLK